MNWLIITEYLCHRWSRICSICRTSRSFPHSWLFTGFVTRVTRRVPLAEHELLTIPKHLCSLPDFSGVRVGWSLVFYVAFCRLLFVLLSYFFWPFCCLSFFNYGFWFLLPFTPLVSSNSSLTLCDMLVYKIEYRIKIEWTPPVLDASFLIFKSNTQVWFQTRARCAP